MPTLSNIPENLDRLHTHEEDLRSRAIIQLSGNDRQHLHLAIVEAAMDLADTMRQFPTGDENLKVIQLLGMRIFNAFGASIKLTLSGYGQNSVLIMRDILETVFLLDLFHKDPSLISKWRTADEKTRRKNFSPIAVRTALDQRDGFNSKKRMELYNTFNELAAHPNMKSYLMMRPQRGGDAVIGPFIESSTLEAILSEKGRFAFQAGGHLSLLLGPAFPQSQPVRATFLELEQRWLKTFYPDALAPNDTGR